VEVASVGDGLELTARKAPTTLLVAITSVGLLLGVLGLVLPGLVGARDEHADDRQAVVTRASDFAVTFNTYSVDKKADYQRRVKPLMTKAYYKDFLEITNAMFQVIKDKDQSSGDVKVLSVAVDTMDDDSAVAVVAIDAAVKRSDSQQAVARRFRWQVTMSKVGEEWLVSQFDTVPPMEATLGDVTQPKGAAK
jgi:Mce-associated membrane protein